MRFKLRAIRLALLAALGCAVCGPAGAIEFTSVLDNTENVTSLPADGTPEVIYSAPVTYVSGDILQAAGEFEVTNDTGVTAHVWAKMVLGSSTTDTTGTPLGVTNEKVLRSVGHHGVRVKGAITALGASGYVNLVAWSDKLLTVEAGNGEIQGMVILPPTSGTAFSVYDSNDSGGELLTSLPGDNTFRKLYSVDVSDLQVNDILIVFSEAQLQASSVSGKQRLTTHVLRADPTTSGLTGSSLDAPNALNVTSTSLIVNPVKVAIQQVTGSTADTQVNFLVQATTALTITAYTGRLQVLKSRP